MGILTHIQELWRGMTGDMSGRYQELRHRHSHGELNDLEKSELEWLEERFGTQRKH